MADGPVLHHRARGVHPGAFVQATEPITTDVQDGVLWVDTSTAPPFALRVWDQAAGLWHDVGTAGIVGPAGPAGPGLPPGHTGDLLYNIRGTWRVLPPGRLGQKLDMVVRGSALVPGWVDDCCADSGRAVPGVPGSPNPCTALAAQRRCGAAFAMATYLEKYYANMRTVLNAAGALGTLLTIGALADLILGAAPAVMTTGGFLSITQIIRLLVRLVAAGLHLDTAPVLDEDQQRAVLGAIYCALPTCPAALTVSEGVRQTWLHALDASTAFSELQAPILGLLSRIVSLAGWQTLANLGVLSPRGGCATCGAGAALQGGAQLGPTLTTGLQGGAQLGPTLLRALQGGAQFGPTLTRGVQGGATS
jgi:hypothetical protein